ncbi:DUF262 domain-containing protein [Clostridium chromiireducens]|uniref:DUF262 domain-containing protein n=1 Tax=Clostridium chromiireducens TaxID=225345 RepID=A0A399IQE4_9CLOT|nr:DUF262 domain-containing protein [Clostridium chromiireducens]RII35263.1 DUF262 domain-containing protein [Clostridium chromiireducens]
MGFDYIRSAVKLAEIRSQFKRGKLVVDTSYQRRKVWLPEDKIRLIETITLGYIIPELFFWDAATDPETGLSITHIVDGQQRVNAIFEFTEGAYKLSTDCLISDEAKEKYGNKYFNDFSESEKIEFWNYPLSVVQINEESKERIKMMFYRLNLTDYDLNAQEKRHGTSWGKFADLTTEIASLEFWEKFSLFNSQDIRRMRDNEFCATLIILARKGVIDQTTQKAINDAYTDYAENYEQMEADKAEIFEWMKIATEIFNENNLKFFRKKTQLYTLFSLIRYMRKNNIKITSEIQDKIDSFITQYNDFKNDSGSIIEEGSYEDKIRIYKLASSEGVNKLRNRNIRLKVFKEIISE